VHVTLATLLSQLPPFYIPQRARVSHCGTSIRRIMVPYNAEGLSLQRETDELDGLSSVTRMAFWLIWQVAVDADNSDNNNALAIPPA